MVRCFQDLGFIPRNTKLTPQRVLEWWTPIFDAACGIGLFTFTPILTRIQVGLYSVLLGLGATCHSQAIHQELRDANRP